MSTHPSSRPCGRFGLRVAAAAALGVAVATAPLTPAHRVAARTATASDRCLAVPGTGAGVPFARNFNPIGNNGLSIPLIYEPLLYQTPYTHKPVPALATSYKWINNGKTLVYTIRKGVTWSDGVPMTAKDVLFSYRYIDAANGWDKRGGGGTATGNASINVTGYRLIGQNQFAVDFRTVDSFYFWGLAENFHIIPEHIWSKIAPADASKNTNPDPVGTGPFTVIRSFNGQEYTLGRNAHYWQAGKPYISCVGVLNLSGSDATGLALARGDIDWANNPIQDAQKAYSSHDPAHFHAYFPRADSMPNGFYYNDQLYPWSLPGFRKALSVAIDRQRIVREATFGHGSVTDGLGFNWMFPGWMDPKLGAESTALAAYNPSLARQMLTKLGFTYKGSDLIDPHGHPVSVDMHVVSSNTEWLSTLHIISDNWKAIGVNANVVLDSTFGAWFDPATRATIAHLMWTYAARDTPFQYFYAELSHDTFAPPGEQTFSGNWARWSNSNATTLINQWRGTLDTGVQHQLADKLERIMLQDFPYIPVYVPSAYYQVSTRYFTGWPTPGHWYAGFSVPNTGDLSGGVQVLINVKPI